MDRADSDRAVYPVRMDQQRIWCAEAVDALLYKRKKWSLRVERRRRFLYHLQRLVQDGAKVWLGRVLCPHGKASDKISLAL